MNSKAQLVFLELNEVNFDIVEKYLEKFPGSFVAIEKLVKLKKVITSSETKYELLEPWIQWVSVHTGLAFDEHQIFRLGDIIETDVVQCYECIEDLGYKVGAISPMNAKNNMKNAVYFIPDPWTCSKVDGGFWCNKIYTSIKQAVNDNSRGKLKLSTVVFLMAAFLKYASIRNYPQYLGLIFRSNRRWNRALFLDLFLFDFHQKKSTKTNFASIFLNAGAHIQHHYFLNSIADRGNTLVANPAWYIAKHEDPFFDMMVVYDKIISRLFMNKNQNFLVSTGLSQKPYDRIKFYWRLKNHGSFLRKIGIEFIDLQPRMTRDFLVSFSDSKVALNAEMILRSAKILKDDVPVFDEIENRGDSLFVTLTYPNEITKETEVTVCGTKFHFYDFVSFVAIKNGMHQSKGFNYFSEGVDIQNLKDGDHVKNIYRVLVSYFKQGNDDLPTAK